MLLKPKHKVRVTAIDANTGKSKSMTVYDTDPQSVITWLRAGIESEHGSSPERSEPSLAGNHSDSSPAIANNDDKASVEGAS